MIALTRDPGLAACVGDVLTEVIGLVPDASVVDGELVALVAVGPDGELTEVAR